MTVKAAEQQSQTYELTVQFQQRQQELELSIQNLKQ